MNRQRDRRSGKGGRAGLASKQSTQGHTATGRSKSPSHAGSGTSLFGSVHPGAPLGIHNPIRKIEHCTTKFDPRKPDPRAVRG